MSKATAEQLKLINKFAKVPLTEENCLVHGFRLIGTKFISDRCLKFDRSLLEIYMEDAKRGDTVQIADHTLGGIKGLLKTTLPFGRFFNAQLVEEGGETQLDGWMYMLAGQKTYVEPFTTDDIDQQLDAGTLDDSSVGVIWDKSECSICGNDIRDHNNCPHLPYQTYKVQDKEMLCYVIAKPSPNVETRQSMMLENSLVGVGAYPDAGHLSKEGQTDKPKYRKVDNMMELKLIPKEEPVFCLFSADHAEILTRTEQEPDAARLHDLCHRLYQSLQKEGITTGQAMRQLTQKHTEAAERLITQQGHYMEDALDGNLPGHLKAKSLRREENKLDITALVAELSKKFNVNTDNIESVTDTGFKMKDGSELSFSGLSGTPEGKKTQTQIDQETQQLQVKIDELTAKVKELEPLAKDGEMFRKEVIDEALAAGVRAQGNDFPAETWKNTFSSMAISAIRDIAKTFQNQAESSIPAGRRTTPKTNAQAVVETPDAAYKA